MTIKRSINNQSSNRPPSVADLWVTLVSIFTVLSLTAAIVWLASTRIDNFVAAATINVIALSLGIGAAAVFCLRLAMLFQAARPQPIVTASAPKRARPQTIVRSIVKDENGTTFVDEQTKIARPVWANLAAFLSQYHVTQLSRAKLSAFADERGVTISGATYKRLGTELRSRGIVVAEQLSKMSDREVAGLKQHLSTLLQSDPPTLTRVYTSDHPTDRKNATVSDGQPVMTAPTAINWLLSLGGIQKRVLAAVLVAVLAAVLVVSPPTLSATHDTPFIATEVPAHQASSR